MSKTYRPFGWFTRNERKIEWSLLVLVLGLFIWSLLDMLGMLSGEPGFQPRRMVILTLAMITQSAGSLLQQRSRVGSYSLLALAGVLLIATFFVR